MSRPIVHRYLDLLETYYQLVRLEPYAVNRTKRLIKTPKLYWSDSGLALHLGRQAEPSGFHLENLILNDLLAWRDAQVPQPEILHWRTTTDLEMDFVIEDPRGLIAIEIKAGTRPGRSAARAPKAFRGEYSDTFRGGLLLRDSDETQWISEKILDDALASRDLSSLAQPFADGSLLRSRS